MVAAVPLGIMPRSIWMEKRLQSLNEAICRYLVADEPVPVEWLSERNQLTRELKKDPHE